LWEALELAGLKDYVDNQAGKLDAPVTQMGENLSLGQRQLLCLAAVILKKPKILVLDEATSSLDKDADEKIKQVIQTVFSMATVISIAHRLDTVANFDRIIVLEDGKISQSGDPKTILETVSLT